MPKYRKKPVVIEAFRMGVDPMPDWAMDKLNDRSMIIYNSSAPFLRDRVPAWCKIETPEGTMTGYHGDWIIKGVKGEIYPCKPDIFEATYDLVEEV